MVAWTGPQRHTVRRAVQLFRLFPPCVRFNRKANAPIQYSTYLLIKSVTLFLEHVASGEQCWLFTVAQGSVYKICRKQWHVCVVVMGRKHKNWTHQAQSPLPQYCRHYMRDAIVVFCIPVFKSCCFVLPRTVVLSSVAHTFLQLRR